MPIFTITSDWHKNDFYAGAIKGYIVTQCPDAQIFDITHEVENFNVAQAAFIIRNTFKLYPKGTIHLICINSEPKPENQNIIVKSEGHYFIGADNGIFGLLLSDKPEKIYKINTRENEISSFPELHIFAPCATKIALNKKFTEFTTETEDFYKQIPLRPAIDDHSISGGVIYIDSYQNGITNITKDLFERIGKDKPFDIFVQSHHYKISKINKTYKETTPGELLALFNSVNLLEIAINNGNAARLLNLEIGSNVRINFKK